jgi:hypothetical protein
MKSEINIYIKILFRSWSILQCGVIAILPIRGKTWWASILLSTVTHYERLIMHYYIQELEHQRMLFYFLIAYMTTNDS